MVGSKFFGLWYVDTLLWAYYANPTLQSSLSLSHNHWLSPSSSVLPILVFQSTKDAHQLQTYFIKLFESVNPPPAPVSPKILVIVSACLLMLPVPWG